MQIIKKILTEKQGSVSTAAILLMGAAGLSKVLGLVRDRLLATYFGDSDVLGVYFAAFRLPDLIFQLIIIGALSSAFIPIFSKLIDGQKEREAWKTANSSLSWALLIFSALTIIIFVFMQPLSFIIAPGFTSHQHMLLVQITRVIIIAQVFFVLSNFLIGVLQSFEHFLTAALAPLFYNLGIIIGIVFLTPALGIMGPAWGVIIGTFLHFFVQLPKAYKIGWRYKPTLAIRGTQVVQMAKLALPRIIGQSAAQIDYTVDVILASLISASSLVYFNFAQHLQLLPVSLFGISIAQAALPKLSKDSKDLVKFKNTFTDLFHQLIFLTAPFAVLMLVLRIPLTRLAFGAARFDWEATLQTAYTLSFFAISIVAQSSIYLLARAFFALGETKQPTLVGIIAVLANTIASFIFVLYFDLPVWSLGFSCSVASTINALLLLILLNRKVRSFSVYGLIHPLINIGYASVIMGVALFIPLKVLDLLILDTTKVIGLLVLTGIVSIVGIAVYLFICWQLKVPQLSVITRQFKKYGFSQQGELYT